MGRRTTAFGAAIAAVVGLMMGSGSAGAAPGGPPGPPTQVTAKAGAGQIRINWTPPSDTGGNPITGYTAQAWDRAVGGGKKPLATCSTTGALTCVITGLAAGTTYYVDIVATNGKEGRASDPRVTATPYTPADTLAGTVYFKSRSAELDDNTRAALDAIIPQFERAAAVRVDGYVQKSPGGGGVPAQGLSKQRAIAVANYIGAQIRARGWDVVISVRGKGQPPSEADKASARRADIVIIGTR